MTPEERAEFIKKLRDQKKFDSLESLKAQIRRDLRSLGRVRRKAS